MGADRFSDCAMSSVNDIGSKINRNRKVPRVELRGKQWYCYGADIGGIHDFKPQRYGQKYEQKYEQKYKQEGTACFKKKIRST